MCEQKKALKQEIVRLREAMLDITGVLNRPQPDAALITTARVDLDRALFPLLARVDRRGPLAVGELAELSGRDYTTVSRQVAKLETLGLVMRSRNPKDARVTDIGITRSGRKITRALDRAREQILVPLLEEWDPRDVRDLARLLRKLADTGLGFVRVARGSGTPG
jgi:DNA-binding MarR family transcriptional regulator